MASVAQDQKRPSILGTVVLLFLVAIVGIIAFQWITGIILWLIRTALILVGFYLVAKIAIYLLRKGR